MNLLQHGNAVTLTDHLPCQKLFLISFPLVIFNPYTFGSVAFSVLFFTLFYKIVHCLPEAPVSQMLFHVIPQGH